MPLQDRKTRATTALKLIQHCIADDDQAACDFLATVIEAEQLYLEYVDDDGKPYESMEVFAADLEAESAEVR